jgi:hypothetical protein
MPLSVYGGIFFMLMGLAFARVGRTPMMRDSWYALRRAYCKPPVGHSSVSITLDIYSHVLPDMQQDAAAAIAAALGW